MRNTVIAVVIGYLSSFTTVMAQTSGSAPDPRLPNIAVNGSFEQGDGSPTSLPDGWEWGSFTGTSVHTWDDQVAKVGNRSVKISAPTVADDARWSQTLTVSPNTLYYLSGWIKTQQVAHSPQSVDVGANVSVFGGFTHSWGVLGTQDWTPNGVLFNSGSSTELTIAARLGFFSGTTTGTAWFDDVRLTPVLPLNPHPSWKILVLIYRTTDFTFGTSSGPRHVVASMSQAEADHAADEARKFVESDIPALTSGNMVPSLTVRYPDHPLTRLSPSGEGWWPAPNDTAQDRDPAFDSVIVIWDPRTTDQATGQAIWIGSAAGLTPSMGTDQAYATLIIEATTYRHRNVFKHEWGHSITDFFAASQTAPKPMVNNHATATDYVNCLTGAYYVWVDESDDNPIPNSIYNNESGFTHDYYSGLTATAGDPTRCLGIDSRAWSFGGPVSNFASYSAFGPNRLVNDQVSFVVRGTSFDPRPVSGGPAGVYTVDAVLTNAGPQPLLAPVKAVVNTLTGGNRLLLLSVDEGDGGDGSKVWVDTGSDYMITPGESVKVRFIIGLASRRSFTFLLDVEAITPP